MAAVRGSAVLVAKISSLARIPVGRISEKMTDGRGNGRPVAAGGSDISTKMASTLRAINETAGIGLVGGGQSVCVQRIALSTDGNLGMFGKPRKFLLPGSNQPL
jgi:hypothetical protein